MTTYFTCSEYIQSRKGLESRIIAIDELIDAMLLRQIEFVENNDINLSEYQLNDGQVQLRTRYNSPTALSSMILELEKMKQIYVNRRNGRRNVLRDINN